MIFKNKKGFTLVELIIVITILSILSTIAFISFSGYTVKTRDSKRLSDISNIKKSIEIFSITTGKYPDIESENKAYAYGKEIFKYGEFNDGILNLLKIKGLHKDNISSKNLVYGVTLDNNKFQVGSFLEESKNFSFINKTYANSENYISLVDGNYDGIIKFSTGGKLYISNPPSLLLNNTGSIDLFSSDEKYFLINNGNNIYHNIKNIDGVNNVLSGMNGSGATLTGVLIDNINSDNIANYFTNENGLLASFGGDIEKIGNTILGNNSSISYNNCEYNGFGFNHGEKKVFYKSNQSFNCLNDGVIYSCNNGIVYENSNIISGLTEFSFDQCVDNTTCRFDIGNLFDGTCHF